MLSISVYLYGWADIYTIHLGATYDTQTGSGIVPDSGVAMLPGGIFPVSEL